MSKWSKRLFGIAAIGGAVAGIAYYLKKSSSESAEEDLDVFEDEDFDLDNDLKPVTDREYVPLNPSTKSQTEESEEPVQAEESETTEEKPSEE